MMVIQFSVPEEKKIILDPYGTGPHPTENMETKKYMNFTSVDSDITILALKLKRLTS